MRLGYDNNQLIVSLERHEEWLNHFRETGEMGGSNPGIRLDLSNQSLSLAREFKGLDLSYGIFVNTCLTGAILSDTNLSYADLYGADLNGVDLSRSDLKEAVLTEATLGSACLARTDLSKAFLDDIRKDFLKKVHPQKLESILTSLRDGTFDGRLSIPEYMAWQNPSQARRYNECGRDRASLDCSSKWLLPVHPDPTIGYDVHRDLYHQVRLITIGWLEHHLKEIG